MWSGGFIFVSLLLRSNNVLKYQCFNGICGSYFIFSFFNLYTMTSYHLVDNWCVFLLMLLTCFSSPSYFFVGYALIFLQFSWGVLSGLVITLVNSKTVAWIIGGSPPCFLKILLGMNGLQHGFSFWVSFLFPMHRWSSKPQGNLDSVAQMQKA